MPKAQPVAIVCTDGSARVVPTLIIAAELTGVSKGHISEAMQAHKGGGPVMTRDRILQTGHPPSHPTGYQRTMGKGKSCLTFKCPDFHGYVSNESGALFAFCSYSEEVDLSTSMEFANTEVMPEFLQTIAQAIDGREQTKQGSRD